MTDSGDLKRTGDVQYYLEDLDYLINIDHHPQNGDVGDLNLVNTSVSSVGEIIYEFYDYIGEDLSSEAALALYVSLLTDTGSFRHSNTTARCHRIAADLIERGSFEPHEIYNRIYEQESFASTRLLGHILARLEHEDGVVWGTVPTRLFQETETTEEDLNDVISYIRRIEGCKIALLFRERDGNQIKINFRAKGEIDLLEIVQELGGGGHRQAAGATVEGSLDEVANQVVSHVKSSLTD
ncbi:MAG: bifunctional oligoribonuclease/PAP phosphatase NrnA [bacterium]